MNEKRLIVNLAVNMAIVSVFSMAFATIYCFLVIVCPA